YWTAELGGAIVSNLVPNNGSLFLVTAPIVKDTERPPFALLRSLSRQTGLPNWSVPIPPASRAYLGFLTGSVIVASEDGTFAAYSSADGTQLWKLSVGGALSFAPVFNGTSLLAATDKRRITAISGEGKVLWAFSSEGAITAVTLFSDHAIALGSDRGNILRVSDEGESEWNFRLGGQTSLLEKTNRGIISASYDNFLYMLSGGGRLVWKRRLPARITNSAIINENFGVFAVASEGRLYLIDLKAGRILDQADLGEGNSELFVSAIPNRTAAAAATGDIIRYYAAGSCVEREKRQP
ncbi:MAG: PQQ-like beta-propeller repeat protein, partial [Acidobacteria bacterium]|nr:PQQ-like beta-propeller repeat protein [Acidobacteriota bacterium]